MTIFSDVQVELPPEEWTTCILCGGVPARIDSCRNKLCVGGLIKLKYVRASEAAIQDARNAEHERSRK